ncbi:hypothetical protein D8M06_14095 [Oceanobacillus halophilus]|uniref:Uncharacterized protein n=1 Tax=Oceanobacillus halophilus TaxID=930130 RepID=A0A494ZXF7_9BACI|nr:hypothetical protein D8M06_14095 [Oceanobacillus halophilus]
MSLLRAEKRVRLRLPVMLRSGLSRRKGTRKIIQVVPSLRSLTDALLPAGQGMLRQGNIARRKKWSSFFKESPCISFAKFLLYLILTWKFLFLWEDSPKRDIMDYSFKKSKACNLAEAEYGDSCGKSTCPKTPQRWFFREEAEAVPAESEVFCRSES